MAQLQSEIAWSPRWDRDDVYKHVSGWSRTETSRQIPYVPALSYHDFSTRTQEGLTNFHVLIQMKPEQDSLNHGICYNVHVCMSIYMSLSPLMVLNHKNTTCGVSNPCQITINRVETFLPPPVVSRNPICAETPQAVVRMHYYWGFEPYTFYSVLHNSPHCRYPFWVCHSPGVSTVKTAEKSAV